MFYLSGSTQPTTAPEFIAALEGGFRQALTAPPGHTLVKATGDFPNFDTLIVDLTGCRIDPSRRLPSPKGVGPSTPAVKAGKLTVVAAPMLVETGRVNVDLSATDVELAYDHDADGRLLLLPGACRDGKFAVEVPKSDLEALIFAQAKTNAAQQGAQVTGLQLDLKQEGERAIVAAVRVTAKKMMFSGVVHIAGRLDVTDDLKAKLSGLDVRGEGMAGSMAAGFLKPKVKQAEGKIIPLADFAVSGIHLRDIRVASVDPVRVTAAFGS